MRCIIIEDENHAIERLELLLNRIDPSIEILAKIVSVEKSVEWLKKNTCDLIFLDIHLRDDTSFSIFNQVQVDAFVIFTTAYDEYAMEAFTLNSLSYLLKPVLEDALRNALNKYRHFEQKKVPDYNMLTSLASAYQKRFLVHSGNLFASIPTEDIAYFHLQNKRYTILVTKDKSQYVFDSTMEILEQRLDPDKFFRINRQFIISFEAIHKMHTHERGRLRIETMPKCKEDMIVSIDKAALFKNWLNR